MKTLSRVLLSLCLFGGVLTMGFGAPRKVLVEMQTSTTCSPCYAADVFYFHQWLPNYGGADQVVTLAYHVWWPSPGNDPMYLANPGPVQARVSYNGGTSAPQAFIDGFVNGGSGFATWPGAIEARFIDASPVSITITGSRNGATLNLNAAIYADRAVNSANWRVHWVVVESGISAPQNSPSGYVPFVHDYAFRNMYPDANGSPITISQGQTVNIPRSITLNASWVANNCRVIVFVQNNTDRKVQNVEYLDINTLTSVGEPVNGVPTTFALAQNYPNPFNPTTTFDYAISKQSFVQITVYDLLGREVRTLLSEEKAVGIYNTTWDGTNNAGESVPSGMYLYRMSAGTFTEAKKMLLLK